MAELIFLGKSMVIKNSKTLLIDCGIGVPERIEENRLSPHALVLSSRQPHDRGGLSNILKNHPDLLVIEAKSIKKRGKKLNLDGIEARPFKTSGRDVYGWKIKVDGKSIIYAPNTPDMAEKFLVGSDVAVLGDTIHFGPKMIPIEDGLVIDLTELSIFKTLPHEDLVDSHAFVAEEMERRGMKHDGQDKLDEDSEEAMEKLRDVTEEVEKARHRRDQCMRCKSPPIAQVLWAEGRAMAWFCAKHLQEFKGERSEGDDIDKAVSISGEALATEEFKGKPNEPKLQSLSEKKEQISPEDAFGLAGDGLHICVCPKCGVRMRGSRPEDESKASIARQFLKAMAEKTLKPGFWAAKVKGKPRWWAVSSTTHRDREGETITRKALEIAHRLGIQEGFGPLLYEHVPKARIGECDGQLLVGDYLLETGTFNSDDKGRRGFKALSEAEPGKYKISIGFAYWFWSKVGKTYKAIRIFERSATVDAANPFTSFEILKEERKMLSEEKLLALKEIFGLDDDEVQEWLKDEGEEGILKVLKALQSDEGKKEEKKKEPEKDEKGKKVEKKKEEPSKKDEEEDLDKEKAVKAETALKGIAKFLSKIEPEEVRSNVAKLLQAGGVLDRHEYGELASSKALEGLTEQVVELKSLVMERAAVDAAIVDGLIEATKQGNIEALEAFKGLLKEKEVKSVKEGDDDEDKLTDEEKQIVEVAKKALEEVLKEQSGFDRLYNDPRFQSQQK